MPFVGDLSALPALAASLERQAAAMPGLASAAVEAVRPLVASQVAAGRTPYGELWLPKKDGRRALAGAHVELAARGDAVVASVTGELVYHNAGTAHGPRRQLIPDDGKGLPETWRRAIDVVVARALGEGR
jgi:NADPH-dependent ferric siderophore reductase